jgi:hypothetical protein
MVIGLYPRTSLSLDTSVHNHCGGFHHLPPFALQSFQPQQQQGEMGAQSQSPSMALFGEPLEITSNEGRSVVRPDFTAKNGVIHLIEVRRA